MIKLEIFKLKIRHFSKSSNSKSEIFRNLQHGNRNVPKQPAVELLSSQIHREKLNYLLERTLTMLPTVNKMAAIFLRFNTSDLLAIDMCNASLYKQRVSVCISMSLIRQNGDDEFISSLKLERFLWFLDSVERIERQRLYIQSAGSNRISSGKSHPTHSERKSKKEKKRNFLEKKKNTEKY